MTATSTALVAIPHSVAKAARILDKKIKGWYNKIDTSNFRMESNSRCLLAQLFDGNCYDQNIFDENSGGFQPMEYGYSMWTSPKSPFSSKVKSGQIGAKDIMWLAQIEKRKARNAKLKAKRAAVKTKVLPETIVLFVTKDVLSVAKDYSDNRNCPIATAAKQQYPQYLVQVGPYRIRFFDKTSGKLVKYYDIFGSNGDSKYISLAIRDKDELAVVGIYNPVKEREYMDCLYYS